MALPKNNFAANVQNPMKTFLPTHKARTNFSSGFTLIELLVVIAIIAILAAILFPVFARARENARRSSCQSNLKQMGIAFLQYNQDYDEKMPFYYNRAGIWWMDAVQPYVKSYQVWKCPSDSSPAVPTASTTASSYGANACGYTEMNTGNNGPMSNDNGALDITVSISSIEAPSSTLLAMDTSGSSGYRIRTSRCTPGAIGGIITTASPRYMGVASANIPDRHLETTNTLYTDGHVKSVRLDRLAERDTSGTFYKAFTVGADPD